MTEFEQATLAAQHVALWISAASAAASAAAAWGIWYGIRAMVRANKDRAAILDRQREADERRHKEAMAAHAEAMAEGARRHEENMTALKALIGGLERQTASLERVVERTAPPPAE